MRSAAAQRAALDSLGGPEHAGLCRRYAEAYRARREAAEALDHWRAGAQARQEEAERLREWLEALEALKPSPGEDHELTAEAERLDHAEDLRLAAGTARTALVGQEDVVAPGQADAAALLAAAQRALAGAPGEDDRLAELAGRTRQLSVLTADIAADLGEYLVSLDADPARLAWIQDRRGELARACRDIGGSATEIDDVDALLAWGRRAADRLAELDGAEDSAASLEQALAGAHAALDEAAGQLTAARRALAGRLEAAVTAEIDGLQMKGARLVVELEPLDEPGPTGAEAVCLMLVSHPGAPALPLGKGASGGELSRIMLALEVVLADAAGAPQPSAAPSHQRTFVFDEIDAGVGGRAAREIGRRLARLARRHQVVVVTHLAQVAAWADTQLVVVKETKETKGTKESKRAKGAGQTQDTAASLGESQDDAETAEATRTRVVQVVGSERVTACSPGMSAPRPLCGMPLSFWKKPPWDNPRREEPVSQAGVVGPRVSQRGGARRRAHQEADEASSGRRNRRHQPHGSRPRGRRGARRGASRRGSQRRTVGIRALPEPRSGHSGGRRHSARRRLVHRRHASARGAACQPRVARRRAREGACGRQERGDHRRGRAADPGTG